MEVMNILHAKIYKLTEKEKVPVIKNRLGRKGLHLIQTFINSKKEACKTMEGLFSTLGEKFKLYLIKAIFCLQYGKLKEKVRSQPRRG